MTVRGGQPALVQAFPPPAACLGGQLPPRGHGVAKRKQNIPILAERRFLTSLLPLCRKKAFNLGRKHGLFHREFPPFPSFHDKSTDKKTMPPMDKDGHGHSEHTSDGSPTPGKPARVGSVLVDQGHRSYIDIIAIKIVDCNRNAGRKKTNFPSSQSQKKSRYALICNEKSPFFPKLTI